MWPVQVGTNSTQFEVIVLEEVGFVMFIELDKDYMPYLW
jgi:hypothetical protein